MSHWVFSVRMGPECEVRSNGRATYNFFNYQQTLGDLPQTKIQNVDAPDLLPAIFNFGVCHVRSIEC